MNDTPRTDSEVDQYDGEALEYVDANFARELERERPNAPISPPS